MRGDVVVFDGVVVVFEYTCCCCVGVDCGELMEPRVARIGLGREMADWSMYGEGVVLLCA